LGGRHCKPGPLVIPEFTDGLSKIYDELVQLQDERNANIAASKAATVKQQQLLQ
jgi:hypothetical protein